MITKGMEKIYNFRIVMLFFLSFVYVYHVEGQFSESMAVKDTILLSDTAFSVQDTSALQNGNTLLVHDSSTTQHANSSAISSTKKEILETQVVRSSDSSMLDLKARKAYLFGNAKITYGEISIAAAYVEVDFAKKLLYACGLPDSTGTLVGNPVLNEHGQEYSSISMKYNFESKRGLIQTIITHEGDGYMHGTIVKKEANNVMDVADGWYTTCDLDHPHFGLRFQKAKVIPNNKIVVGSAYMVIEDAPTPLWLPFAMIPNKKNQKSGIIVPNVEEKNEMGLGFTRGGFYWYINDYADLRITGDIYTRGSWAIDPLFTFKKMYKYNGSVNMGYNHIMKGVIGTPSYRKEDNYRFQWSFVQDPKAHPTNRFAANVNIQSAKYNTYTPSSTQDRLTNTYTSNVNFSTSFSRFNYSVSAQYTQNTQTHDVSLNLPNMNLGMNQVYPFRRTTQKGPLKWYENISVRYTMNAGNNIKATDSTLFVGDILSQMNYGMKHNIPISAPLKLFKVINGDLGINYNEYWYGKAISRRDYVDTAFYINGGNQHYYGYSKTDTINGFASTRDFSFNASLNTKLYGMFLLKKGYLKAVRHVLTPSVSFSYHPDFGRKGWNNYKNYLDRDGRAVRYSRYQGSLYGGPPDGESGLVNFSLSNNLEMKVRSSVDTITGTKKIKLIDIFTISIGYDVARDSLNWTPLRLAGNTTIFQGLRVSYGAAFDPYALNSKGTGNIKKTEWEVNRRLFRFENSEWAFNLDYQLNPNTFKKNAPASTAPNPQNVLDRLYEDDYYIDWTVPWNVAFGYTLRYSQILNYDTLLTPKRNRQVFQTVYFNGDVSITPKWKMSVNSGYDISNKLWNFTSITFSRDLHCWEMSLTWEPIGTMRSWRFHINIKASSLREALKYEKKKDFRDTW
jgi:hypothetical protein